MRVAGRRHQHRPSRTAPPGSAGARRRPETLFRDRGLVGLAVLAHKIKKKEKTDRATAASTKRFIANTKRDVLQDQKEVDDYVADLDANIKRGGRRPRKQQRS